MVERLMQPASHSPYELRDNLKPREALHQAPSCLGHSFKLRKCSILIMSRKSKDLPTEILENVLARLPVHVLSRFRLVCKAWNHWIIQPSFASLRTQLPQQASYVLITPGLVDFLVHQRWDWEMLDMAEKRIYSLSDSYLRQTYYLRGNNNIVWDIGKRYILAADGGLIYAKL